MASWDEDEYTTSIKPQSAARQAPPLSMIPMDNVVPVGRYSEQVYPQYNFYGPPVQSYRPTSYQHKVFDISQTTRIKDAPENKPKSWTDKITISHTIGFLSGLIFLGIPLGVMITIYILYSPSDSTGSTTTSSVGVNASTTMPYQCTSYSTINDQTRVYTYSTCCYCDSTFSGWYRITGLSGTQLVTYPINNNNYCSSHAPAWWNGTHPTTVGTTTVGYLCVNYNGYICYPAYSVGPVLATNCNGYYVYYFQPFSCPCCFYYPRFCTM